MTIIQLTIKQKNPSEPMELAAVDMRCEIFTGEYPTEAEEKLAKGLQSMIQGLMKLVVEGVDAEHGPGIARYMEEQDPRVPVKEADEHTTD